MADAASPQSPFEMAAALERGQSTGEGVMMPDLYTPLMRDHGALQLPEPDPAGFPLDFLTGLTGVEEHGVMVYPVTAHVDDVSGETLFRNAEGEDFWAVPPMGEYSPDWICRLRLGGEPPYPPLTEALLLPSHVEARWVFVDGQDMAPYRDARDAELRAQRIRRVEPTRRLSETEPDLRTAAFSVGTNAFHFTVEWNGLMEFPLGLINVWYTESLTDPDWCIVHTVEDIQGGTADAISFDILFEDATWAWTDMTEHDPNCTPITNLVVSPLDPGVTYTNVTCSCPVTEGQCPAGFFKVAIAGGGWWGGGEDEEEWESPPPDFDDGIDTGPAQWVTLTGDLDMGITKTLTTNLTVKPGQVYVLAVYVHSEEYPDWTQDASRFNDFLTWRVDHAVDLVTIGQILVNNRHGAWETAEANGVSAQGFFPAHLEDIRVITAPFEKTPSGVPPPTETDITVKLTAVNVADGTLPSTVIVGLWPLKLVQGNMPNLKGQFNSTDMGQRRLAEIGFGTNAVAYITGDPEPPQLYAYLKDAPDHINVTWSMTIRSERTERNTLDNRDIPAATLAGDAMWNIKAAMNNEIVGGKCTLTCRVEYAYANATYSHANASFLIRGKNPKDANVTNFMNQAILPEFSGYAWAIAQHESRHPGTAWVFNQFNPQNGKKTVAAKAGTPNKTAGQRPIDDGWGIGQITVTSFTSGFVPTAVVWDWNVNIVYMNNILTGKRDTHTNHVARFERAYGAQTNWQEPPALKEMHGVQLPAEAWGVMIYYNGASTDAGMPAISIPGYPHKFCAPWEFNPKTGEWKFHTNKNNYEKLVADELRGLVPTED